MPSPSVTHDEYWRLTPEQRLARQHELKTIPQSWANQPDPSGPQIYEALQPPLYYWLLSAPYRIVKNSSLFERVFLLRYISLVIASLSVPLVFFVAYRVIGSARAAVVTSVLLATMPELMVNVCRVGNECLGIVLYSSLILLSLDLAKDPTPQRTGILVGLVLGLGLLTKAYFLTAVPAVGALYTWRFIKSQEKRTVVQQAIATFGIALLIAGWWYLHNRITTGTWSGLSESVMLRDYTWQQFLDGIQRVEWERAIDSILMSHVWFGGWSSLVVRSWMYHFLFTVAAIGAAGVGFALWRSIADRPFLYPLMSFYGFFWIGQLYNVLLLFLSKGASTSMGWYMYCVIAAEVTLLVVGLRSITPVRGRIWVLSLLTICLAALDLYTVHFVSIPYYTGLIAHRPNGFVAAFHLSQLKQTGLPEVLNRLCTNKPSWLEPTILGAAWVCYVAATVILIALPLWLAHRRSDTSNPQG